MIPVDRTINIMMSGRFHLFLALIIYYFMPENWTLSIWFYVYLLANAWDIVSTYTFVYIYGLGWERESNDLVQQFAKYMNYHWAIVLQTTVVGGPTALFCILWPWPGFSICILIYCSVGMFIAGIFNFLLPIQKLAADLIDHGK